MYCLPKNLRSKLVKSFKDGSLKVEDLIMAKDSAIRRAMFEKVVGKDHAKKLNGLFETKMQSMDLAKAMKKFIKEATGMTASQKKGILEIVQELKNKKLFTSTELGGYKEDYINQRLGISVSIEEATKINKFAMEIAKNKKIYNSKPTLENQEKLGLSMLDLDDYVYALAPEKQSVYQVAANYINFSRAAMASFDLSFPGRQGRGFLHRKEWWKSWKPMFQAVEENNYRKLEAQMVADPFYDRAIQDGLRISKMGRELKYKEEVFASDVLQGKIPGMDESQRAYTMFANNLRFTRYKELIKKAEMAGEDITARGKSSRDIADVINTFSGAGTLRFKGKDLLKTPIAQTVVWSPGKLMGTVQIFNPIKLIPDGWTAKNFGALSPTARKEHVQNLLGYVGTTASMLLVAEQLGADIEWNPISPDFGKIRVGDGRYDVSGGNASYIVLLSKLLTGKAKSSTTGDVRVLGEGYKASTRADEVVKFTRNKLSPVASFVWDFFHGENTIGEPFELSALKILTGEVKDLKDVVEAIMDDAVAQRYIPLIMGDIVEAAREDVNHLLPMFFANLIGVNTQIYSGNSRGSGSVKDLFK